MAKKKKELTPEERLAEALVPEEEWPYELPSGWKWVRLDGVCDFVGGGTPSKENSNYWNGDIPWASIKDIKGDYLNQTIDSITEKGVENSSTNICPKGNLIVATRIEPGKTIIANIDTAINQDLKYVQTNVDVKFLHRYFQAFKKEFEKKSSGSTVLGIKLKNLQESFLPLPSVTEQQRIVARIESLFVKLDEAQTKVQDVLDDFETRKAALLHEAFSGTLTAKWRKENGVSFTTWQTYQAQDVCDKITCGKTPTKFISFKGEIPYLKVYNIVNNKIAFAYKPQFIPRDIHENKLKSSRLRPFDVVMNIVGPPLRKIAIIPDTYPEWNMNQAIVRFRPKKNLYYRFLYYELLNPSTLDAIIQETKGVVGQANISLTQSRELKIIVPSLEEQHEIVRILDNLFAKEEKAKSLAEKTLASITQMKQSILARAFRGEL